MNAIDTKPQVMAPGLYFGLADNAYHADRSLGSGSVRELANHPIYYWRDSWMNQLRADEDEDLTEAARERRDAALIFGRALHKFVLEGRAAFEAAFAPRPTKADHPEALDTVEDIRGCLRALGQKVSGSKADLIERMRLADPAAVLWEDVLADFKARCARDGITPLKASTYIQAVGAASFIADDERVRPAFQGGRPEVSVFAEIDGVPCKCRLDYVRLGREGEHTVGLITDLKSYSNIKGMPPERAVLSAVANYRLDIQAALYLELAAGIPEHIKAGRIYGAEGVNAEWLEALSRLGSEDWRWFWCFFEKGAPINMLRDPDKDVLDMGRADLSRALQSYREHMQRFGTDWRFVDPMPETRITLSELPKWMGM